MRHFSDESGIACGHNPDGTLELTTNKQAVDCPRCIQALATMSVQIDTDPFGSACDHELKQVVVGTNPDGSANVRMACVKCGDDSFPDDGDLDYDSSDISWSFVEDPPDQSSSDDDWYALHQAGRLTELEIIMSRKTVDEAIALAHLALAFGRVERVTRHEDGIRPETDADHTMMLMLIACQIAPYRMDRNKICQFALVHDLVEAVKGVGDTQTLTISDEDRKKKEEREKQALEQLREQFGADSWLIETLDRYEGQMELEARFVKVLDKVMPKLTHLFNGAIAAKNLGVNFEGFMVAHQKQVEDLKKKYPDQSEALELLQELCQLSEMSFIWRDPSTTIEDARKRWTKRTSKEAEVAFMKGFAKSLEGSEGLPIPPTKEGQ